MNVRIQRPFALALCALFALAVLLPLALTAGHAGCCHVQRCPVCHLIQTASALFKQLMLALSMIFADLAMLAVLRARQREAKWLPHFGTPVSLFVRMNN